VGLYIQSPVRLHGVLIISSEAQGQLQGTRSSPEVRVKVFSLFLMKQYIYKGLLEDVGVASHILNLGTVDAGNRT
jgi:hypothetical protein